MINPLAAIAFVKRYWRFLALLILALVCAYLGYAYAQNRYEAQLSAMQKDFADKGRERAEENLKIQLDLQNLIRSKEAQIQLAEVELEKLQTAARPDADRLRRKLGGVRLCPVQTGPGVPPETPGSHDSARPPRVVHRQIGDDLVGYAEECEAMRQRLMVCKAYGEAMPQP